MLAVEHTLPGSHCRSCSLHLPIIQLIVSDERNLISGEFGFVVVAVAMQHVLDEHAFVWHKRGEDLNAREVVQLGTLEILRSALLLLIILKLIHLVETDFGGNRKVADGEQQHLANNGFQFELLLEIYVSLGLGIHVGLHLHCVAY